MKRAIIQVVTVVLVVFAGVRQSFGQLQYVRTTNLLAVADSSLLSGSPDSLLGYVPFLFAGIDTSGTNRAVFCFDVSGIPTNATVTNVTLDLIACFAPPTGALFGVSRMLTNWDEAAVNWHDRSNSTPWTVPGGMAGTDFASLPSAFTVLTGTTGMTNRFTDNGSNPSFGLVHDVQTWINDPAQNFGWMLAAADEGSTSGTFWPCSREDTGSEPMLTVGYTQPFTPPIIKGAAIANGFFQFSFNVEPYHGYGVQRSDDLTGTNWVDIRVLDPPPWPTDATVFDLLTPSNRFYRVAFSY